MSRETIITVCQGPPRCDLVGDAAIECQANGCVWCMQILVDEDGNEFVTKPGEA